MLRHLLTGLTLAALVITLALGGCGSAHVQRDQCGARFNKFRSPGALIFSKTAGYRHDSIPDAVACISMICRGEGLVPTATEDASIFTDEGLKRVRVIIFLSTTGDILNTDQQGAMERFVQHGGGFVGIHAAADTEYDWPWYGQLVGAWFKEHPKIGPEIVEVQDAAHPATHDLPAPWPRIDEWYRFRSEPPREARLLLTLAPREAKSDDGDPHPRLPVCWCREFDGGRTLYTSIGHTKETYQDPLAIDHFRGAIRWAARLELNMPRPLVQP